MRASAVVNCQSIFTVVSFRVCSQAPALSISSPLSPIRSPMHCRFNTPNSISAMFSQERCLGVYTISSWSISFGTSSGVKASYSEDG